MTMTDRGDRLRPSRWHHAYWHLTGLRSEVTRVVDEHVRGRDMSLAADYGCGNMPYRSLISPHVERYLGFDLGDNPHAHGRLRDDGGLPLDDGAADLVISSQTLEHVDDPERYLKECRRVLSARGLLLLSTHGVWRYHPDPHDYWRYTSEGLRRIVTSAGFSIDSMTGLMGRAAAGLQLLQDDVRDRIRPALFSRAFVSAMQVCIEAADRAFPSTRDEDASTYVIVARRN